MARAKDHAGQWRPRPQGAARPHRLLLGEEAGAVVDAFAFEDDPRDALGHGDIFERVAVDDEKVGVIADADGADVVIGPQQASGIVRGGLEGNGGRYAAWTQSAISCWTVGPWITRRLPASLRPQA